MRTTDAVGFRPMCTNVYIYHFIYNFINHAIYDPICNEKISQHKRIMSEGYMHIWSTKQIIDSSGSSNE